MHAYCDGCGWSSDVDHAGGIAILAGQHADATGHQVHVR